MGEKNIYRDIPKIDSSIQRVWFHCASLGEFEQARPLIDALNQSERDYFILVSFFSPSGYTVRKKYQNADFVCYLPQDSPSNAQQFITAFQPNLAVFIKYEFWYFTLKALKNNNIPIVLAAAIFRKKQIFFSPLGGFYRGMLQLYDKVLVQDKISYKLLKEIKIESEVIPDLRFDRVASIADNEALPDLLQPYQGESHVFIGGSTWPQDDALLLELYNNYLFAKGYKLIVAPHLIDEKSIKQCCNLLWIKGGKTFEDF